MQQFYILFAVIVIDILFIPTCVLKMLLEFWKKNGYIIYLYIGKLYKVIILFILLKILNKGGNSLDHSLIVTIPFLRHNKYIKFH